MSPQPSSVRWLRPLLVLLVALLPSVGARAQAPFEVRDPIAGAALGKYLGVLEDSGSSLTIDDVSRQDAVARFRPSMVDAPGFGISDASYWLRFRVENRQASRVAWLLEVGYPHLDSIELYVPRSDGSFERHVGGDRLPFAERELDFRNVVFRLSEAPSSARTYYMRVRSESSLNVPLRAWTYESFVTHEGRELPILWMFYGVVMAMAVYNLFVYFSVRQREYLYYVLYNVAITFCQFTVTGHTFQFIVPENPELANDLVVFAVALTFIGTTTFQRTFLRMHETLPRLNVVVLAQAWFSAGLALLALFGPYRLALRIMAVHGMLLIAVAVWSVVLLMRKRQRAAMFYSISWAALFVGTLLFMLKTMGAIPNSLLTEWCLQIGAGLEVLLLSLALADRINTLSASMSELNGQLSDNVRELQNALARAEEATRAKGEFLATMSHELRTPLNAIINVPQGLMNAFVSHHVATCSGCSAVFELEAGDTPVTRETQCPSCDRSGTMHEQKELRYCGAPDHTVRHLRLIERSGKHLLQMVNGVLDFSKMDAGGFKLRLETVPVQETVQDAVETLGELARDAGVELRHEIEVDELAALRGDPLRLKQILINLVGNAIKFSNGRGTVSVRVSKEQDAFLFGVRDQGVGISPEHQQKIFERFEQVDRGDTRKYGGTGLGLSISKSLVEMHGGTIWVESALGAGSTFWFRLPEEGPDSLSAPGVEPIVVPPRASQRPLVQELRP
jgi:two-component system, sensor histidine kinase LadS